MLQAAENHREYGRHLCHFQNPGSWYHVTFSLRRDRVLDEAARQVVLDACLFHQGTKWLVAAVAVMPRFGTHILCEPLPIPDSGGDCFRLERILQAVKSFSAGRINALHGRSGPVWHQESFDRQIRNQTDFLNAVRYIANNPVKEGLASRPLAYPHLFVHERFLASVKATYS